MLPQALRWQWRWSSLSLELWHPWLQGPVRAGLGWNGISLSAQSLRLHATGPHAPGPPWHPLARPALQALQWQARRAGGAPPRA
ncbi:general secretion pathway protein GspN, partial [Achromobacter ruhlandii]|nr:general secretion pathway protein GspN [Achromobacter ruhlandii]